MFVLKATTKAGGEVFYTGRAGAGWVAAERAEAFRYETLKGAWRKAHLHNAWETLHGLHFTVVAA